MSKSPKGHSSGAPSHASTPLPGEPPHHGGDSAMIGGAGSHYGPQDGEPSPTPPATDAVSVKPHLRGRPGSKGASY